VHKGKKFVVTAVTKPVDAGITIFLQRYRPTTRSWSTLVSRKTTAGGKVSVGYTPNAFATYRLLRSTSKSALGSHTSSFTVKVTE
jgi:hypothetical protein